MKNKCKELQELLGNIEESSVESVTQAMVQLLTKYNRATNHDTKLNILCAMLLTAIDGKNFVNDISRLLR